MSQAREEGDNVPTLHSQHCEAQRARALLCALPFIVNDSAMHDAVRIMEEWTRNPVRRSQVIEAMQLRHMVELIKTIEQLRPIRGKRSEAAISLDEKESKQAHVVLRRAIMMATSPLRFSCSCMIRVEPNDSYSLRQRDRPRPLLVV